MITTWQSGFCKALVALLIILAPVGSLRAEEASKEEMVAATILLTADWLQTRYISTHGYSELNPILGRHPSIGRVNNYFGTAIMALWAIHGSGYGSSNFVWLVIGVESATVVRNYQVGIRFQF